MKLQLKNQAISLRLQGLSYSEVLRHIPVARSTLSLWLRSVSLSQRQKQRLTEKKLAAILRGGLRKREQRLKLTEQIKKQARSEIIQIDEEKLFLMGVMLYWAEGSKAKEHNPSQCTTFTNSDPLMIKVFLKWLFTILHVPQGEVIVELVIHRSHYNRVVQVKEYWSRTTGLPLAKFDRIYYKRDKPLTKRKNVGEVYYGLLRIRVQRSTNLNRKIAGWIEGICLQCGVV